MDASNISTAGTAYTRRYPAFVYSVMDGTIAGSIYIQSSNGQTYKLNNIPQQNNHLRAMPAAFHFIDRPLWVETSIGLYYAGGGNPSESFYAMVSERCQRRIETLERFTLFSGSTIWNEMVSRLPGELRQLTRQAMDYSCDLLSEDQRKRSTLYELKKINESVIQNSAVFDEKYYRTYWGSSVNYLQNGIGYAIWHENEVICECTSIFANTWTAELDIYTAAAYRGKGLALIVAKSFIDHCIHTGRQPIWECSLDNEASRQLAYRLGFVPSYTYSVWAR
ncbi:GNAT family N-acetyltransferase [Paenibacillus dauci]|uniref:GNAT family N-acetyltransferase n=1 Tax=Paenibacillus dauci TaxID=1567106 RepID=UPI00061985DD|nr:GNAT family N-acetyltransferase [Paenibacillus dauci]